MQTCTVLAAVLDEASDLGSAIIIALLAVAVIAIVVWPDPSRRRTSREWRRERKKVNKAILAAARNGNETHGILGYCSLGKRDYTLRDVTLRDVVEITKHDKGPDETFDQNKTIRKIHQGVTSLHRRLDAMCDPPARPDVDAFVREMRDTTELLIPGKFARNRLPTEPEPPSSRGRSPSVAAQRAAEMYRTGQIDFTINPAAKGARGIPDTSIGGSGFVPDLDGWADAGSGAKKHIGVDLGKPGADVARMHIVERLYGENGHRVMNREEIDAHAAWAWGKDLSNPAVATVMALRFNEIVGSHRAALTVIEAMQAKIADCMGNIEDGHRIMSEKDAEITRLNKHISGLDAEIVSHKAEYENVLAVAMQRGAQVRILRDGLQVATEEVRNLKHEIANLKKEPLPEKEAEREAVARVSVDGGVDPQGYVLVDENDRELARATGWEIPPTTEPEFVLDCRGNEVRPGDVIQCHTGAMSKMQVLRFFEDGAEWYMMCETAQNNETALALKAFPHLPWVRVSGPVPKVVAEANTELNSEPKDGA